DGGGTFAGAPAIHPGYSQGANVPQRYVVGNTYGDFDSSDAALPQTRLFDSEIVSAGNAPFFGDLGSELCLRDFGRAILQAIPWQHNPIHYWSIRPWAWDSPQDNVCSVPSISGDDWGSYEGWGWNRYHAGVTGDYV